MREMLALAHFGRNRSKRVANHYLCKMRQFPTTYCRLKKKDNGVTTKLEIWIGKQNTILQLMHEIIRDISESIGLFLSTDRSINVNSTASLLL